MPGDLLRVLLALGGLRPVMWLRHCLELSPQLQLLQSQCVNFRDGDTQWEEVSWRNCAFRRQPGGSGSKCAWQCDLFLILSSETKQVNFLKLEVRECFFTGILSMHSEVKYTSFPWGFEEDTLIWASFPCLLSVVTWTRPWWVLVGHWECSEWASRRWNGWGWWWWYFGEHAGSRLSILFCEL